MLGAHWKWGSFEWLREDGSTSYGFEEPGVYPYVCTWHPGMVGVGVVVVGDPGETTSAEPVARVPDPSGTEGPWRAVAGSPSGSC